MKQILRLATVAACALISLPAVAQKTPKLFGQTLSQEHIDPETQLIRCGSTQYENHLRAKDDKRASEQEFENWITPLIEQQRLRNMTQSQADGIITIPVVVHVIHGGQAVGTAPNIVDAQIESQITVLNQDYRRMAGTPGFNTNAVGADTGIQFALAKQDPNGFPTNGINRVNMCKTSFDEAEIESTVKPNTIWDPTQYLNIWVISFTGSLDGVLGYAQFPSNSGLNGLNTIGGSAYTDGVAIGYQYFGSVAHNNGSFILEAPFNRGRTASHEVGHWLGLRHIWGDSNCGNDYCADTPVHHTANYSCNTTKQNCTNNGYEMVQNYMDYTNDSCMNIFTNDQKVRMQTVLNNATRRASLKTSTKDQAIPLFANDADLRVKTSCSSTGSTPDCSAAGGNVTVALVLTNRGTANITSASITVSANGQTATYPYTGNLAPHASAEINVPVNFDGPYTFNVATVNGTADQRPANNQGSVTGGSASGPETFNESNYVFKLTQDRYGDETTWVLKNSAGTTLYSGGPYNEVSNQAWTATPRTFNFSLPANDCYTLTVYDDYGDGMCCQYRNGGFSLETATGAVVIPFEGSGTFTDSKSVSFRVSELGLSDFEQNAIYLYPNPGKEQVAIRLATAYEAVKVTAFNVLGQQMPVQATAQGEEILVNTSSWSKGMYLVQVQIGDSTKTMRFIKQ